MRWAAAGEVPGLLLAWVVACLVLVNTLPEKWDLRFDLRLRWAVVYGFGFFVAYLFMKESKTMFLYYQF